MRETLLRQIEALAGVQRAVTFRKAAEFIITHKCRALVETGCFRGTPADGQSTLILSLLAMEISGTLDSFDISIDSIVRAKALLVANDIFPAPHSGIRFHHLDSVAGLSSLPEGIRFAYLDSYDHDPNNFLPCQQHQLAEVMAILGKMSTPCTILMDDNIPPHGGKVRLSVDHLRKCGWETLCEDYQVLMAKL